MFRYILIDTHCYPFTKTESPYAIPVGKGRRPRYEKSGFTTWIYSCL